MKDLNIPSAFEESVGALHKGFKGTLPATDEMVMIGGKQVTLAEVHQRLGEILHTHQLVHQTKNAHLNAVSVRKRAMKGDRAFHDAVVLFLRYRFGNDLVRLHGFGVELPKPRRKLTSAELLVALRKAAETRRQRQLVSK